MHITDRAARIIDLMEIARLVLNKWKLLFIALLAGAVVGGLYCAFLLETTYRAEASLYITSNESILSFSDLQLSSALTETESHLESESETKSETESQSIASESAKSTEADLFSAENPRIIVLNGTGKVGVAAYWKRFLQGKGFTNVVMADYKGEINDHTVVYVTAGGNAPKGVYDLFPNAEYREEGLDSADPNADTNVKIPDSQKKFDFYDVWILVGKDDALHD